MPPLSGVNVVEVSMWAFVPSCGAVLADWGATVTKVEPPSGDPIRSLTMATIPPGYNGITYMWEIFNRGKRGVALDLRSPESSAILHRLVEGADVFLVSLLPDTRRELRIDAETIRRVNPRIVYASGSGQGPAGPDAGRPGYDAMTFWARGGVSAAVTPDGYAHPIGMPVGAFGDCLSGALLAGGIAAALVHRLRTGEGSVVDGSLLGSALWGMQAGVAGSELLGIASLPKIKRGATGNPLVGMYRTADGRHIALNMLQPDRYWQPFCEAIGRKDLVDHPQLGTAALRQANIELCLSTLDEIFASRPLSEWRDLLARQPGQWDVLQEMGELGADEQAIANGYVQRVEYPEGHLTMVAAPVQFDGKPPELVGAPGLGADTDEVLAGIGLTEGEILQGRIDGYIG